MENNNMENTELDVALQAAIQAAKARKAAQAGKPAQAGLNALFNRKLTENGDDSYVSTGDEMIDILFQQFYFEKHLNKLYNVVRGRNDAKWQLFSLMMRDPRFGFGRRDLGRKLMALTGINDFNTIRKAGRIDDCFYVSMDDKMCQDIYQALISGDQLCKKWMPRIGGKDDEAARAFCKALNITQKEYRALIKCDTVEHLMSEHQIDNVNFEHVPSLAMLKYYRRFLKEDRFREYLEKLKKGEAKINTSVTNVYDLYRNLDVLNETADIIFNQMPKIELNCIPIIDTSGSMEIDDCIGRAYAIGHYLAKCSTYCPDTVVSFSSEPHLMKLWNKLDNNPKESWMHKIGPTALSVIAGEMRSMYTGDCSNTDFGAVMDILSGLGSYPDYLVVLSDMEFDQGSAQSKDDCMKIFKEHGAQTKIVWWSLNTRNQTAPEIDQYGNIFISGYNPQMLQFLDCKFDCHMYLNKLLEEYKKNFDNIK